jgi:hypothetical protein
MNTTSHPPMHVPTLTEVIELLSPTPVHEDGLQANMPPRMPQPDAAPIVTGGLHAVSQVPSWTPMSTVVLEALDSSALPAMVVHDVPVAQPAPPMMPDAPNLSPLTAPLPLMPDITEAQLAQRVLGDVQRQIDGLLDFRLREALNPILARHGDALVRDLREELGRTMRDVVARSVAQEMAKFRQR